MTSSLSRPLANPLAIPLTVVGGLVLATDADARAYIGAVKATGVNDAYLTSLGLAPWATLTPLLDAYFIAQKSGTLWAKTKRQYLAVWGADEPNSICLSTRLVGSFDAGTTASAGYVTPNGTSSYFEPDAAAKFGDLGLTDSNCSLWAIRLGIADGTVRALGGIAKATGERFQLVEAAGPVLGGTVPTTAGNFGIPATTPTETAFGLCLLTTTATNLRVLVKRTHAGIVSSQLTSTLSATIPNIVPRFMSRNVPDATSQLYDNQPYGAYGFGLGMTLEEATTFSELLVDLYEAMTGIELTP